MSIRDRVRVFAPATLSNLGPGFDVLGLALEQPGDLVDAEWSDRPGVEIAGIRGNADGLTTDPTRNVVGIAAAAALRLFDAGASGERPSGERPSGERPPGVRLCLDKRMPLASGLGSSAASSVAGALAVSELLGGALDQSQLVASALEGERAVSGGVHADNVAPCVTGGFVLIRSYDPLELLSLPVPEALRVAVVRPHTAVATAKARRLVAERRFAIADAVANLGQLGAMITALHRSDLDLLGRSVSDALVEPVRAPLVPGFAEVQRAALEAGALGCSLSGSGPSVFAFAASDEQARALAARMCERFRSAAGLECDSFAGGVNVRGACRVDAGA